MRVIVHRSSILHMMSPGGSVGRATARAAGKVRDRAKDNARDRVDSGLMRNSIVAEMVPPLSPYSITWRIGSDVSYTPYQELGTGPIFPRRAPMLTFKVKGKWVSVHQTRGVPAGLFLTRAIEATTTADFRGGKVE